MKDNFGQPIHSEAGAKEARIPTCNLPPGRPLIPANNMEYSCYYVWKAAFHCKRAWEVQSNIQVTPINGEGPYIGDPFTKPKFSHHVTDPDYIKKAENTNSVGKWLRCTDCIPYNRHWVPLVYIVRENHCKNTFTLNEEGGVDVPCPDISEPPQQFTYQDLIDQNITQYCPNYYTVSKCIDCAGFTSTPNDEVNNNLDYSAVGTYVSLPHDETFNPQYPIIRAHPYSYTTETQTETKIGYGCYTWKSGGTTAVDGKSYPDAGAVAVYDKKNKQSANKKDSFRYFDTCEDCQNDIVLMFEKCDDTCDGDDVLNSYDGSTLIDAAAATRAGNCINSGNITFKRMVMNTGNLNFARGINGKTYIWNNTCVKITHVTCPNILIRSWYHYYWDGTSLKLSTQASHLYIGQEAFPALYVNCEDCNAKRSPIQPAPEPPARPIAPPPIATPRCAACNLGEDPSEKVLVYKILVKGKEYEVYELKKNASVDSKFLTPGKYVGPVRIMEPMGRWARVKIATQRNADGTWDFDAGGWKAGEFRLDEEYDLIKHEMTLMDLGTTPSAWRLPVFTSYTTCRALSENDSLIEYSECGL